MSTQPMLPKILYWAVACRPCGFFVALAPVVAVSGKADLVLRNDPFEVECPACKRAARYSKAQVITWLGPQPEPSFSPHPDVL